MSVAFVFSPREGSERLHGPVRSVTIYQAAVEERFGEWMETAPRKLRTDRFARDCRLLERERFYGSGALRDRSLFVYDEAGRLAERTHYDPTGRAVLHYDCRYDAAGRPARLAGVDPAGRVVAEVERRYRRDGALAELVEVASGRETAWSIATDEAGAVAAAQGRIRCDGMAAGRLVFAYEATGAPRGGASYDAQGRPADRWRNRRDPAPAHGNWVRRVTEHARCRSGRTVYEPTLVVYRRLAFFAS